MKFDKSFRLRVLFTLFIVGFSSLILLRTFEVSDYWWHVKSGLYMLENQTIPFQDVFSWYGKEMNLYWVSHEWLGAIILALFHQGFGAQLGGYLFNIVGLFTILFSLLYFNEKSFFKNIRFTFGWVTLGLAIISYSLNARPQLFSVLLLIWVIGLLETFKKNEHTKSIWILPFLAVLWSNLHGGSSNLVYILPILYFIGHFKTFQTKRWEGISFTKNQKKKLLLATALSFLALAINPHNFEIWSYPYANMGDQFMMSIIQEWRSPDLKQINDWIFFIQFAIIGFIFIQTPKKIKLNDFLLMVSFIALNLRSIRFGIFLYVAITFVIFNYIPALKKEKITEQYLYILASFGLVFSIFSSISYLNLSSQNFEPMQHLLPEEILQTLKELNPQRLYNDYDFGSELIYQEIPVFIDGRADLYSKHNLKDVIALTEGTGNTQEILDTYDFDVLLLYKNTPLSNYLSIHPDYELIQETASIQIYIKKEPIQRFLFF